MRGSRWLTAAFVAALVAGPLMPIAARAQVRPTPSTTTTTTTTTTTITGTAAAPAPMQSMQPEIIDDHVETRPGIGAKVGAGVLNVVYVPGKAIVCTAGTLVAGGFMLATFGSAYREAVSFFKEGCAGSWILTPEQVAAVPNKVQLEY